MSSPPFGPVQMLVLEFDGVRFNNEIMPEHERLKDEGVVRLIDLIFVKKPEGGELEVIQRSDLSEDEAMDFGAMVGALAGLGAGGEEETLSAAIAGAEESEDGHFFGDAEVWYLSDAIPDGASAAVALIEHQWAIPLRDKILAAGGSVLADEWVHPADLMAIGATVAGNVAAST